MITFKQWLEDTGLVQNVNSNVEDNQGKFSHIRSKYTAGNKKEPKSKLQPEKLFGKKLNSK